MVPSLTHIIQLEWLISTLVEDKTCFKLSPKTLFKTIELSSPVNTSFNLYTPTLTLLTPKLSFFANYITESQILRYSNARFQHMLNTNRLRLCLEKSFSLHTESQSSLRGLMNVHKAFKKCAF